MDYINLLNANVYLTNLLLVPSIVFSYLIVVRIYAWQGDVDEQQANVYAGIWLTIICILTVGVVLSNIHHLFMFSKNRFLNCIGDIDSKFTAPLIALLLLALNVFYIIYLVSPCNSPHGQLKVMTKPIYIVSAVLSVMGIIAFIVRKLLVRKGSALSSLKDKSLYITGHTFFHYTVYTGAMLLFMLYYVENKDIYISIFEREKC